jgi:hypothetical protein
LFFPKSCSKSNPAADDRWSHGRDCMHHVLTQDFFNFLGGLFLVFVCPFLHWVALFCSTFPMEVLNKDGQKWQIILWNSLAICHLQEKRL